MSAFGSVHHSSPPPLEENPHLAPSWEPKSPGDRTQAFSNTHFHTVPPKFKFQHIKHKQKSPIEMEFAAGVLRNDIELRGRANSRCNSLLLLLRAHLAESWEAGKLAARALDSN